MYLSELRCFCGGWEIDVTPPCPALQDAVAGTGAGTVSGGHWAKTEKAVGLSWEGPDGREPGAHSQKWNLPQDGSPS